MWRSQAWLSEVLKALASVLAALAVGALVIRFSGQDPIATYTILFQQALVGRRALAETLLSATPLLFTGLATAVAFRAGVFNVGVEGSLYLGGFAAVWVGFTFTQLGAWALLPWALAAAGVVGALWGLIPGLLKAYVRVDEIVSTIMLNYVAILFTSYLVNYPFKLPGTANSMTAQVVSAARLPRLVQGSQLHLGFVLGLVLVAIIYLLLYHTTTGLSIRTVGSSSRFARYAGIDLQRTIVMVMLLSGLIGGLAGASQILGLHYRFFDRFSPGYGFDGIAVALLGRNHPLGVLLAALLFGALRNGGSLLELFSEVPRDLINVLQATIILILAAEFTWGRIARRRAQLQAASQEVPHAP
ncbi:MAG: ABC transporter permease [Deinococcus sp.]|nr:ABC transporter permease [Deinococcus sp.]